MKGEIRYLLRKDIEDKRWNECVRSSINGLCYSDSDYLDAMSADWSALVLNDYQAVMPLTWRRKFGIHYLYQPAFCQQTGITMEGSMGSAITEDFLSRVPKKFKYWDIQLNAFNSTIKYNSLPRKNFLLSLAPGITELQGKYHRNAVRNIRKAQDLNIQIKENIEPSMLMQLHLSRFKEQNRIKAYEYKSFENLLARWSALSRVNIIGARDNKGDIIASSGYILYKNRITFVINGNADRSLTNGASHLLKDHIIRKYAGSDYILDFEGSDNPDFARFYQQFGAEMTEYYPRIIVNRLPWPLNGLKPQNAFSTARR